MNPLTNITITYNTIEVGWDVLTDPNAIGRSPITVYRI
jgi:hypothetical protein